MHLELNVKYNSYSCQNSNELNHKSSKIALKIPFYFKLIQSNEYELKCKTERTFLNEVIYLHINKKWGYKYG